jgi:oligogalacturonide lyase
MNTNKQTLIFNQSQHVGLVGNQVIFQCINKDETILAAFVIPDDDVILMQQRFSNNTFHFQDKKHTTSTIYIYNLVSRSFSKLLTTEMWVDHMQFSSVNPDLLIYTHKEDDWSGIDRIWVVNIKNPHPKLIFLQKKKNVVANGNEIFDQTGQIWFGQSVLEAGNHNNSLDHFLSSIHPDTPNQVNKFYFSDRSYSTHYSPLLDGSGFVGDGSDTSKGIWLYHMRKHSPHHNNQHTRNQFSKLIFPQKLVNLDVHDYRMAPKSFVLWGESAVIFEGNFDGFHGTYYVNLTSAY